MNEQTGKQMPFMNYAEVIEAAKRGGRDAIISLVKFEKGNIDDCDVVDNRTSVVAVNLTNQKIREKLLKCVKYYEKKGNADFSEYENKILGDADVLCVIYSNQTDLYETEINYILEVAQTAGICTFKADVNNKPIDEIIAICNELSCVLYEPALINISPSELNGFNIMDGFVVTKKKGVDLVKECVGTFAERVQNHLEVSQIMLIISCGYNVSLADIYTCVDQIKSKLSNGVNIVFAVNTSEKYTDICKIAVIFQSDGEMNLEIQMLDEKLQTAYEKYQNSGDMPSSQNKYRVTEEQIENLCKQNAVTTSIIQRHLSIGYVKAARILDDWDDKGYIIKNNNARDVVDKEAIRKYLMEMFIINPQN